ncbi:hypothetical protein L228DRAFT_265494 [Xylona heveae TC161]|uniref:C2H2 type master regulator of conidiophore development brlA n=1 Tax=Xylona heveae (strain CBS 132557 / TC161) TaxID=1328760 RepID=A0A165IJZ6_XYLHT|nr:hypothetical protein L228DRAFT_265494 [Xylona heveae TC161]KZF25002.1 hypothetical protein L228DRAFT_265494 [Xylona heveae TC161]
MDPNYEEILSQLEHGALPFPFQEENCGHINDDPLSSTSQLCLENLDLSISFGNYSPHASQELALTPPSSTDTYNLFSPEAEMAQLNEEDIFPCLFPKDLELLPMPFQGGDDQQHQNQQQSESQKADQCFPGIDSLSVSTEEARVQQEETPAPKRPSYTSAATPATPAISGLPTPSTPYLTSPSVSQTPVSSPTSKSILISGTSTFSTTTAPATSSPKNELEDYGLEIYPGAWRCKHPECKSHVLYTRACDLRKHFKRHIKHLCCRIPGCPEAHIRAFSSKKDLERHEKSHNPNVPCAWPTCEKVFSREDNMRDHFRRIHQKPDRTRKMTARKANKQSE